ncbi:MAG: 4-(cytidine 5'-diphospho)-2-C-methyl-D-erythritol kinase [Alphaproteobacteria bacterium]|nr:4-(cytidine 5'-diphospho)-2-C-methyl-D-erythritol kinase [Alphaproteobacteria bacterium]
MLEQFAPAKVNLALHVLGHREDGYHRLDSLVVFAGVGDRVRAAPAATLSLTLTGPRSAALPAGAENLVLRAAERLAATAGVRDGARLVLDKQLPVASGIGGGSTDAAAALRLLARLWRPALTPDAMRRLALGLGADVPVCLAARPARMGGIGEVLTPAPDLPPCGMVLINPGVAVATPAVFAARQGAFSPPLDLPPAWPDAATMARDLGRAGNDLEAPAITLAPAIGAVLAALGAWPGCLLARMSGSGATCFGLFDSPASARTAAAGLARPGWWCWGGGLVGAAGAAY